MTFRVSNEDADRSLLQFLKDKVPEAPSVKALKRAIESRSCRVNGKLELFSSRRLKIGDKVEFVFKPEKKAPSGISANILYEDDDLFAIDKPAGVVSSPTSLQGLLPAKGPFWLVHRLDKDTTGVLLLAKTKEAKEELEKLFAERKISKTYLAIVHGWLHEKEKTLSSILVKNGSYAGQTLYRSVQQGKGVRAITKFALLKKSKAIALIQCEPLTGRTHQLRVQLASLGSPIIGDTQYGKRQEDPSIQRQMLHAWKVSFTHPKSKRSVEITAPLPDDFQKLLRFF
jgi:RluA family pseudouridine synthase